MKLSSFGLMAGLAASTLAQDLLFLEDFTYEEYNEAVALGFSTETVTEEQWASMTTADFAKYKAIVIPDPYCSSVDSIKFLEDSKAAWSPAITGNIILIGTDPSYHFTEGQAKTLIDNSLKFAAAGTTPAGVPQTGLYFALSCYYEDVDIATVDALSYFGDFQVRGNLDCYNKVHLVADSGAMDSLDDASLSDWSCSVHEAFASYPSVGTNGFQALAIAQDILGVGSQEFGDGTKGLPYIISRGATPAKCGDGVWDEEFGEECDDGNTVNGDGCSLSCKCESGLPKGDGTCYPRNDTTPEYPISSGYGHPPVGYPTSYPTAYPSGYTKPYVPGPYGNSSATPTYSYPGYTKPYTPPPYVTPSCPTGPKIIGVEYIVEVTYKSDKPVPCSTLERPIYDVSTSILPCYICAMSSEHITYTSTDFVTVTTTACPKCEGGKLPTYTPPVVKPCHTCTPHTFTETECIKEYEPIYTEYSVITYETPTPHIHTYSTDGYYSIKTYGAAPPPKSSYYAPPPAYTPSSSWVKYPTAVYSSTVYPTATGSSTGFHYKPTAVMAFEGAAVATEVKIGGLVVTMVLAAAVLL